MISQDADRRGYREGQIFDIDYPFVLTLYLDRDPDGCDERLSWKPGTTQERCAPDDFESVAHGTGKMRLTIVGTFKPSGFPERVFFTRKWIDPDGRQFGKNRLHIKARSQFTNLTKGYRHEFRLIEAPSKQQLQEAA
jgi:hypothetical protein